MKNLITVLFAFYSFSSYSQVILNEVQSSNSSTIADEQGEYDDWIEIHNPTANAIEIGGLVLKDQVDTWDIPTGNPLTLIPPGGYFFLWADDQEFQGEFHTNFKLASGGEFLGLYESDSVTVIDSLTIPALNSNDSYVRCDNDWFQTSTPTPLANNDCTVSVSENVVADNVFSIHILENHQLEIHTLENLNGPTILSIYSLDGREILKQTLNHERTILNPVFVNSALYIVTISRNNLTYSKRILW